MTQTMLGYVEITHRGGVVEKIEYMAHQLTAIGWTFQLSDEKIMVVHPSSVVKMEITKYKIQVRGGNGVLV